jgi:2-amino-1-hydroxyethylphosphonate dioxygenase (glycine-forming)
MFHDRGGADDIGEPISQVEHACQAAQLAEQEGYEDEVVLAALFHDIGHLFVLSEEQQRMGAYGVLEHERIGADMLRQIGFPERMAKLVQSHVAAKRYLCQSDPDYFSQLSHASLKTLGYQGGPMTEEEAAAFRRDPLFPIIIRMRHWDEQAKEVGIPLPNLDCYLNMAFHLITRGN